MYVLATHFRNNMPNKELSTCIALRAIRGRAAGLGPRHDNGVGRPCHNGTVCRFSIHFLWLPDFQNSIVKWPKESRRRSPEKTAAQSECNFMASPIDPGERGKSDAHHSFRPV